MAQNKLKQKVERLTNVVRILVKELQLTTNLSQVTLKEFQLHLWEEECNKLVEELKDKEKRMIEQEEKKLEIPEEK